MPGNRRMLEWLIRLLSVFALSGFLVGAHSADIYDAANNQLNRPGI